MTKISAKNKPSRLPKTAAFQGECGAFSEVALRQLLGPDIQSVPCQRFDQVFHAVTSKNVDCAVIPIENTLHGSIHENYDHLLNHPLEIVGETQVHIIHNLISIPSVSFKTVKQVFSHPVALNQCLHFFADHPTLERVPYYDTAGSVKMLMEQQLPAAAAIASSYAAELYGAKILKRSIEDDRGNFTRFFLLQRKKSFAQPTGTKWKTSLVFATANRPGSLFRAMAAFALRDLSLTKIESRPWKGRPYEYLFYLDFLGKADDEVSQKALAHLAEVSDFVRVLGSYPHTV